MTNFVFTYDLFWTAVIKIKKHLLSSFPDGVEMECRSRIDHFMAGQEKKSAKGRLPFALLHLHG